MNGIYISYRRADSAGYAALLSKTLGDHFGHERVFYDIESIAFGVDFAEARARTLEASNAVLVIIGPQWLSMRGPEGRRRINDSDDFVRMEVADALRTNKFVIPLLVGGAYMPRPEELPPDLKPLAFRNALELGEPSWDSDMTRLIGALDRTFMATLPHAPESVVSAPEDVGRQRRGFWRSFLNFMQGVEPVPRQTPPAYESPAAAQPATSSAPAAAMRHTETTGRIEVPRPAPLPLTASSHDVFVSHANKDVEMVEAVVATLERAEGIRCWVSYRDIPPGVTSWAGTIVDAIAKSRLVVVVVSQHSNASDQVLRELTIAADEKIPFIAFCIDAAPLSKDFRYYFSISQRLHAEGLTPPEAVARLTTSVKNFISGTV